jgi:hypothetical protein
MSNPMEDEGIKARALLMKKGAKRITRLIPSGGVYESRACQCHIQLPILAWIILAWNRERS